MKPSLAIAMATKKAAHKGSGYAEGGEAPKSMIASIMAKRMSKGGMAESEMSEEIPNKEDFLSDEMDNMEEPPYSPHMPEDEYRAVDGDDRKTKIAGILAGLRSKNMSN